jgi:hypothetical protein
MPRRNSVEWSDHCILEIGSSLSGLQITSAMVDFPLAPGAGRTRWAGWARCRHARLSRIRWLGSGVIWTLGEISTGLLRSCAGGDRSRLSTLFPSMEEGSTYSCHGPRMEAAHRDTVSGLRCQRATAQCHLERRPSISPTCDQDRILAVCRISDRIPLVMMTSCLRSASANNCVQTTPGCALLFILAEVPGAPDAERWLGV